MISVSMMSVSPELPRPHEAKIVLEADLEAEMADLRRVCGTA